MADEKKQPAKQEEMSSPEGKTKISVEVPAHLLEMIDAASRRHADCGRAVIVRMSLYSFFDMKD